MRDPWGGNPESTSTRIHPAPPPSRAQRGGTSRGLLPLPAHSVPTAHHSWAPWKMQPLCSLGRFPSGTVSESQSQPNRSLISPVGPLDDSYSCERLWASGSLITGGVSGWASSDEGYLQNLTQGCGRDGAGGENPMQTLTPTCPSSGLPGNPLLVAWPDHPPPGKGWSG